jgi:beta-lactamase regulating signal transducer with metallopeptidase domain/5-hydroxyisourate hydrolase-like protein (transthyretin family)
LGWFDAPAAVISQPAAGAPGERASQVAMARNVSGIGAAQGGATDAKPSGDALAGSGLKQPAKRRSDAAGQSGSVWPALAWAIFAAHGAAAILFAARRQFARHRLDELCQGAAAAPPWVLSIWESLDGEPVGRTRLLVSPDVDAPLAFGALRPTVIIPRTIVESADPSSLRYCLAHERSHVDRGDLKIWLLVRGCQYLLWYQPAYWLLAGELRLCQELLADQRAARAGNDSVAYAQLLLSLAKRRLAAPLAGALNVLDRPSQLGRRIRRLLAETRLATECRRRIDCGAAVLLVAATALMSVVRLEGARADEAPVAAQANDRPAVTGAKDPSKGEAAKAGAIEYKCQVVDRATGKPIAGANVAIRRSEWMKDQSLRPIEVSRHTTDAEGRFSVTIPPEQVAVPSLYLQLDVEHPDYAGTKGGGYSLAMIRKNEALGARPFFERIELWPAAPVEGTVVTPEGKPLAGVMVSARSAQNPRDFEFSTCDTLTAADGTFRVPATKGGVANLSIVPADYAPVQINLGELRGDVDKIALKPGVRLSGRLLDLDGKGVAGVPVSIWRQEPDGAVFPAASPLHRAALTNADGRFTLAPMPTGRSIVAVDDRLNDPLVEDSRRYAIPAVFLSRDIVLAADTQPVEIKAVPDVLFEGQYYDSKGKKIDGGGVALHGELGGQSWFGRVPSIGGRLSMRIPKGLDKTRVMLSANEHHALRYRTRPGGPLVSGQAVSLGKLEGDYTGLEVVVYDAPLLLVKAVDENGKAIKSFEVAGNAPGKRADSMLLNGVHSAVAFEKQEDGRYRSEQLLPDEAVEITVLAPGYHRGTRIVKLAEGEHQEQTFTLKKLKPGEPAEDDVVGQSQPSGSGNYNVEFVPILPAPSKNAK